MTSPARQGENHEFEFLLRQLGATEALFARGTTGLARVLSAQRGRWLIAGHRSAGDANDRGIDSLVVPAVISGRMMETGDLPTTGDWVQLRPQPEIFGNEQLEVIEDILPRISCLSREAVGGTGREQVIAANIDLALCVMAMGQNYNPSRMERYLSVAWESGAQPVVVITKIDLEEPGEDIRAEIDGIAQGIPSVFCSSVTGEGLDELDGLLRPGRTAALMGSSGAGKSTLLNALAGRDLMESGAISEAVLKGRHTTTSRELFMLPSGALIIDTPGMRELALNCGASAVDAAFTDVDALSARCRFADCSHSGEPGCAVQAAIEDGTIEDRRLKNWQKQRRETERQHKLAQMAAKPRNRSKKRDAVWKRDFDDA